MFKSDSELLTSFNAGELIPLYCAEIIPGDTVSMTTSKVIRAQTLLSPIFGNMYLDTYWFFVPHRLVWNHWAEFLGENKESAWIPSTTYEVPTIKSPDGGWSTGTIADYLGLPANVPMTKGKHLPMALPFRGYAMICDQFFRDQNLSDPLNIPLGDAQQTGSNGDDYINDVANGGKPFKVAKYHDYFTSCLPAPQKGTSPSFPVGGIVPAFRAPVFSDDAEIPSKYTFDRQYMTSTGLNLGQVAWNRDSGVQPTDTQHYVLASALDADAKTPSIDAASVTSNYLVNFPVNLWADFPETSITSTDIDINMLRLAFATQHYLEASARGGSRMREAILAHYGVKSPDERLDVPEYLGGNRVRIQVREVTNNTESEAAFIGDLGANSVTADVHADFVKSFTEFGTLMCVACVRYDHSYQQGIDRQWIRHSLFDFYSPEFANLGEMPVYTDEIFYDEENDDDVFGYQEAWASYRYGPQSKMTGEMAVTADNPLNSWHLGDKYEEAPTLSDTWIREAKENVDRVLAVTSSVSNQFFGNIFFNCTMTRPMPMYSVPGLDKM